MNRTLVVVLTLAIVGSASAADPKSKTPAAAKTTAAASKDKAVHQIERQIAANKVDMSKTAWRTALAKPAVVTLKANKSYSAHMKTNKGRVVIKLMPDVAPMHVTSFMYLTQLDFDDGLKFHRVIQGIMAQGGCPLGTGTGGPVYQFEGEYSPT